MSSRRIVPDEARALKKAGAGSMIRPDQEHLLAIDSVVVIVNPDNPVQQLTTEQLGQIYSGKITNWSEVGGPDQRIQVVGRQETSGTSASFYRFVFGDIDDWIFAPDIEVLESSIEVASFVNNQSNAIGFLGYAFQRGAKPVTIVNRCNMPMIPDSFSAKTGEYTLQSRLYLYNRADLEQDMAKDFLRYATSSEADVMITKAGFIDFGVEVRSQDGESQRSADLINGDFDSFERQIADSMLDEMSGYDRLSTTFRFRTGSSKLDERGRVDMERLVDYLARQGGTPEVLLVGFTDDVGAASANLEISKTRAQETVTLLQQAASGQLDNLKVRATGFGEIAPTACNISEDGRAINRRVEVWIKRAS
jgi:phosphate transport system substrate-binding protein